MPGGRSSAIILPRRFFLRLIIRNGRGDGIRLLGSSAALVRRGRCGSQRRSWSIPKRSSANSAASSGARATERCAPLRHPGFARARRSMAARVKTCATTVAAMEGLGYGCADTGLIFATSASLWTVTMPILAFGTEAQKRRYLPGLVRRPAARRQRRQRARGGFRHLRHADPSRARTATAGS